MLQGATCGRGGWPRATGKAEAVLDGAGINSFRRQGTCAGIVEFATERGRKNLLFEAS